MRELLPPTPPRAGRGGPYNGPKAGGPFGAEPAEGEASPPGGPSAGGVSAEPCPRGAREE